MEALGQSLRSILDTFDASLGDKKEELPEDLTGFDLAMTACDQLFELLSDPINAANRDAAEALRSSLLGLIVMPTNLRAIRKLRDGDDLRVVVNAVRAHAQALREADEQA